MNGVSQVLQNVLNHSNKISLCMPESQQQNTLRSLRVMAAAAQGVMEAQTASSLLQNPSHPCTG